MMIPRTTMAVVLALGVQCICRAQMDTTAERSKVDSLNNNATTGPAKADTAPGARKWYDTLTVTQPRYAEQTEMEQLKLTAFMVLAIPVGMIVGIASVLPPGFMGLYEDGQLYGGVGLQTGIGFGREGESNQFYFFPKVRLQFEGALFFDREEPYLLRSSVLFDHRFGAIQERGFYWLGVAGGGGISTDFKRVSPFVEGWVGILNPAGIRYVALYPMHHYGLRARTGYDFKTGRPWYELSLTASATFWL